MHTHTPATKAVSLASVIKPYQIFDPHPVVRELLDPELLIHAKWLDAFALSAPPFAGKTYVADQLKARFGDSCVIARPSDALYAAMRLAGLPYTDLPYHDFKKLPFGRERLIAAASVLRGHTEDIFSQVLVRMNHLSQDEKVKTVIIDNVGFEDEIDYFKRQFKSFTVFEIQLPHGMSQKNEQAPAFHRAVMDGTNWPIWDSERMDSRKSLALYCHTNNVPCLSSVDSSYLLSRLDADVFYPVNEKPTKSKLAPRYSNTVLQHIDYVYRDNWKPQAAIRDLFDQ